MVSGGGCGGVVVVVACEGVACGSVMAEWDGVLMVVWWCGGVRLGAVLCGVVDGGDV